MDWIGTSGYNYPEWRGSFYPDGLAAAKMLPFYAGQFQTVEINYTFYRMPSAASLARWAEMVPDSFRFTLKAPRRITHIARLRGCEDLASSFAAVAATLGPKLGMVLFQLAPNHKKDLEALEALLSVWPQGIRAAFEFRHASWLDPDVLEALGRRHAALCVADSETGTTPLTITTDVAYFRLRDQGYTAEDLRRWACDIGAATRDCRDVYVYFKHEESGIGPKFAREFSERLAEVRAGGT